MPGSCFDKTRLPGLDVPGTITELGGAVDIVAGGDVTVAHGEQGRLLGRAASGRERAALGEAAAGWRREQTGWRLRDRNQLPAAIGQIREGLAEPHRIGVERTLEHVLAAMFDDLSRIHHGDPVAVL